MDALARMLNPAGAAPGRQLQAGGGGNPFASLKPVDDPCLSTPFGCMSNFYCDPAFGLADAGYDYCYVAASYGELAVVQTNKLPWLYSHGTSGEKTGAAVMQWMAFSLCILALIFYAYHSWKATTGWEEVYVCVVELVKVLLEIYREFSSPASLYLNTANWALWLRYGEWLLTCPVILIHLSNITGLKDDYNKRTMRLLVSDIGCVVWGITAALSVGWLKWFFFALGMLYGSNTYFHAAKVYMESYHTVPKGHCRLVVRLMAYFFYAAWTLFPILFVLGPEGLGHISAYMSTILHTVADMLSKQIWGLLGHHLRVKIYEHIIIHGDIRKTTTMQVGGELLEVEQMMEEEGEDTVVHSTKGLDNHASFMVMKEGLKKKGIAVRASLDDEDEEATGMREAMVPGRVILCIPDPSMLDIFRVQFAQLPAAIELVPALGVENMLQLVQQALQLGGLDFVLLHPEMLRDGSPSGPVARLRMMGQRVCAFGWVPYGPIKDLIESRGLDGWLEGPSFGAGINPKQLEGLILRMQAVKKLTGGGMGGMGAGGMGMMPPADMVIRNSSMVPLLAPDAYASSLRNSFMVGATVTGMGFAGGANAGKGADLGLAMGSNSTVMRGGSGSVGATPAQGNSFLLSASNSARMAQQHDANGNRNGNSIMYGVGSPPAGAGMQYGHGSPQAGNGTMLPVVTGINPLFGGAPSPVGSQLQVAMNSGLYGTAAHTVPPAGGPPAAGGVHDSVDGADGAEVLQQLMSEISKLKADLQLSGAPPS